MTNDNILRNALAEQNVRVFLEDGPRLSTRYSTWIEARDRARGKVLVGGLGAMGVGQMWMTEAPHHQHMVGYAAAPEQPSE